MNIVPQLIVNSIIAGALYSLMALGFNLIYGASKFFNMGHGVMATVGGYAAFYFATFLGLNIYLAAALGVLAAGLVGFLLDKTIYTRLRKTKASSTVLLVASLGAATALQAIIAILFTSQFQSLSNFFDDQKIFQIGSATITSVQIWMVALSLLIMTGLAVLLKRTLFGRAITAISDDEEVAKIVGINTDKIMSYVFFIGSAIAGLAGILTAFDTGIDPNIGLNLLLKAVIASIIGGVGNVYAGVVGAFILGFVENFGIWKINGEWKDAIAFAVLIIFLLFRPQGIFKR